MFIVLQGQVEEFYVVELGFVYSECQKGALEFIDTRLLHSGSSTGFSGLWLLFYEPTVFVAFSSSAPKICLLPTNTLSSESSAPPYSHLTHLYTSKLHCVDFFRTACRGIGV